MTKLFDWTRRLLGNSSVPIYTLTNYLKDPDWQKLNLPTIDYLPEDESNDKEILQRLIAAYHKATVTKRDIGDGVWEGFSKRCHSELINSLNHKDLNNVGLILRNMFRDPVTSGLALGVETYLACKKSPILTALDWHDKAITLGQAVGVLPVQNPEQGEYGTLLYLDSINILHRVVERLGISPLPPQVGAMFGVRFGNGVIPVNHLLHLYTAHRVSTIMPPDRTNSCMEIGGGVGLLAYVLASMGYRQYCIVDLPLVNVLQGYLLLKSDLADRVRLFGEDNDKTECSICIFPSTRVDDIQTNSFDLIINQDSLPEMGMETMMNYLASIQRIGKEYFLSINQEAQAAASKDFTQGWVYDSCRKESGLKLIFRAPYWVRKGYVEELYKISDI